MAQKGNKVTVYGTESCPWCHKAKDFFTEKEIKFKYFDVGKNPKAATEMIEKTDQQGVPVIDINGTIIVGFDEAKIRELLKIK